MSPPRSGRSGGRKVARRCVEIRGGTRGGVRGGDIFTAVERCARFLQSDIAVVNRPARGRQSFCRCVCALRGLESRTRVGEGGGRIGECALGLCTRGTAAVGGFLRRVLGAFPRVERVVEGQTIVALCDSIIGALERILRGREFIARELLGAGGARGVDRALGLLQLFVRRIAACRACQRHEEGQQARDNADRRHASQYTPPLP